MNDDALTAAIRSALVSGLKELGFDIMLGILETDGTGRLDTLAERIAEAVKAAG